MRRSWLGLQLVLSCALLLAVVAAEGRHLKEEESSSKDERPSEKRHHCVEECCEKRCHHEEDECCCEKRCHHEEDECCCEKRCHHEDECCCERRCHYEDECCCEKRCHHEEEECCKKKHSHGKEESGKKKQGPKKRHPRLGESEEASTDSSELYESMAKTEQQHLAEQAAQAFDPVSWRWREKAVTHLNRGSEGIYYKHLEDGQLEYKKAIGVMVYVNILLGKTNCTKTKEQEEPGVEYSRAYLEKEGCQVPPQLKPEKQNCTFGVFIDMRSEKKAVVSQECTHIPRIKQLFKSLKSLRF